MMAFHCSSVSSSVSPAPGDAGVGEHQVQPTVLADHLLHQGRDGRGVGDVQPCGARSGNRAGAGSGKRVDDCLRGVDVDVRHHHMGAVRHERTHQCGPDARSAAGDDRAAAGYTAPRTAHENALVASPSTSG